VSGNEERLVADVEDSLKSRFHAALESEESSREMLFDFSICTQKFNISCQNEISQAIMDDVQMGHSRRVKRVVATSVTC